MQYHSYLCTENATGLAVISNLQSYHNTAGEGKRGWKYFQYHNSTRKKAMFVCTAATYSGFGIYQHNYLRVSNPSLTNHLRDGAYKGRLLPYLCGPLCYNLYLLCNQITLNLNDLRPHWTDYL